MTALPDGPVPTSRAAGASRTAGASALWRDLAGGAAADPGFLWALVVGVVLIALGLLGFVPNPLVGAPSAAWGTPLLLTGDAHDVLHLVGGAVALHAALGLSRARRDIVLMGLGTAALVLLALGLLDGRWFGIAPWPVGLADQLLHLIVGVGSLVMGLAGSGTITVPVVTGAYRRAAAAPAAPAEPAASTEDPSTDGSALMAVQASAAEAALASEPVPEEALPEPLGLEIDGEDGGSTAAAPESQEAGATPGDEAAPSDEPTSVGEPAAAEGPGPAEGSVAEDAAASSTESAPVSQPAPSAEPAPSSESAPPSDAASASESIPADAPGGDRPTTGEEGSSASS